MMWMRYGRDEDKGEAVPEDQHIEDDKKDNEDKMWVRIGMRLSLRITIWRMKRKTMRMRCG